MGSVELEIFDVYNIYILFNENSDLIMRLQDKGNRFIIVDKDTDIAKAEEQIGRSSFVKLHYSKRGGFKTKKIMLDKRRF